MKARAFPFARPTGTFGALLFVLAAFWYAGASHNNSAAYLLLFTLGSIFLISIPHTIVNLTSLRATAESVKPTFAGQEVSVPVEVVNASRTPARGVSVTLPAEDAAPEQVDEILTGKAARVLLRFPAEKRGEHSLGALSVGSVYPLGFLRVTKRFDAAQRYVVYPRPAGDPRLPVTHANAAQMKPRNTLGEGDDFAGVRDYLPGESQRHIDWKAVARGQGMMTKQFATESEGELIFDFAAVPLANTEARLSQLALWIIEAERAHREYGLRLPGTIIRSGAGEVHFHRCLRALALYE